MQSMFQRLLACVIFTSVVSAVRQRYDGHQVWRVTPTTQAQLDFLASLLDDPEQQLDFWTEPTAVYRPALIQVPPGKQKQLRIRLSLKGIVPSVTIRDVQRTIDRNEQNDRAFSMARPREFNYGAYHTLAEINAWIRDMASTYPDRVSLFNIATSSEGRPVTAMKITGKNSTSDKPLFFFNGGIHAREWISPATVIYMTGQLIQQYGNDPVITAAIDDFDWVIVPVVNVDGYEYSWTTDRMWRKTRSRNGFFCPGVDPNRNFDWVWCRYGASRHPCSVQYCGRRPFSEPEVKGLADYLTSEKSRLKGYLDYHGYSQLLLTSWGHTTRLSKDHVQQNACAQTTVNAIKSVNGVEYQFGSGARILYSVTGSSSDWVYGVLGVKYSYTFELRDTGRYGFLLPPNQIIPSGEENLEGILAMSKFILNNP